MENALLGDILQNIVTEKVVRDKIIKQQKEQREDEARKKAEDDLDEFEDEETRAIMMKMKNQYASQSEESKNAYKRTIGEYREVTDSPFRSPKASSWTTRSSSSTR